MLYDSTHRILNRTRKIAAKIVRKTFPKYFEAKKIEEGMVTWNTKAGFHWGDGDSPPQVSAINYHMIQALRKDLKKKKYEHAMEVGCGYGRVTPWISEFADVVTAVEPNESVLSIVEKHYPDINTVNDKAQNLSLPEDDVDLIFTRSVLQHISHEDINEVANELDRVANAKADMLICECTIGKESGTLYPRSVDEYSNLFSGFDLVYVWQRDAPAKTREHNRTRMFFERAT